MKKVMKSAPPVGARVRVGTYPPVKVHDIIHDHETNRTKMVLDWGESRTSYVWLHDENDVWYRYSESN